MRKGKGMLVFKTILLLSLVCVFLGFFFVSKPSKNDSAFVNPAYASNRTKFAKINCNRLCGGYILCNVSNPSKVEKGKKVKLIVVPDVNMKLIDNSLKVNGVTLHKIEFVMPSYDVVVTAKFAKISSSSLNASAKRDFSDSYELLEKSGKYKRLKEYKNDIFKNSEKNIVNRTTCSIDVYSEIPSINRYEVMVDADYGVFSEDTDIEFSRYDKSSLDIDKKFEKNKENAKVDKCIFQIDFKNYYNEKLKAKVSLNRNCVIYIPINDKTFKNFYNVKVYKLEKKELILENSKLVSIKNKLYLALDLKDSGVYVMASENVSVDSFKMIDMANSKSGSLIIRQDYSTLIIMIVLVCVLVASLTIICIKKKKKIFCNEFWKNILYKFVKVIKKIPYKRIRHYFFVCMKWLLRRLLKRIIKITRFVISLVRTFFKKIVLYFIRYKISKKEKSIQKQQKDEVFYKKLRDFFSIKKAICDNIKKKEKNNNKSLDSIFPKGYEVKELKKLRHRNVDIESRYEINSKDNKDKEKVTIKDEQRINIDEAIVRKKTKLMILENELKKDNFDVNK